MQLAQKQQLRKILSDLVETDQVIESHHNIEDEFGVDSIDIIEFVMNLEEHFDISIPDDQIEQCETVGDFERVVAKQLSK